MLSRKLLCAFIFTIIFSLAASAQMPEIRIPVAADEKPVRLANLDVRVRIFGYLAETSMTMTFINDNHRTLEGELYFPLPEKAFLSGYALDVDGQLVDGVAVEKQKAREVFEAEVRKGVDPGIVEKVKGNSFKTRVYPLLPGKARLVRVDFVSELKENDSAAVYRIPLQLSEEIEKFNLRVEVVEQNERPNIDIAGLPAARFQNMASGWFTEVSSGQKEIDSEIVVTVPQKSEPRVMVEKAADGHNYFCIQGVKRAEKDSVSVKAAQSLVIFFDASGSAKNRDLQAEKAFLQKILSTKLFADKLTVHLVPFRNKLDEAQKFSLVKGNYQSLLDSFDSIVFDGAGALAQLQNYKELTPDMYILLSDGINTYGQNVLPRLDAPVLAVTSSQGANYEFMRALATKTGGKFLNLKEMGPAEAVKRAMSPFWGIIDKQSDSGIADMLPSSAQYVDGRFSVYGRLTSENAAVKLVFGDHNSRDQVEEFNVSAGKAVKGDFIRKLWAGRMIEELLVAKDENRREIIKLSGKHGVATEFTSLIVLERVEQYVEHKIVPPASKPEWQKQYFDIVESQLAEDQKSRKKNIDKVLRMWKNRLEWWKKDFSQVQVGKVNSFKPVTPRSTRGNGMEMEEDSFSSAPMTESVAPSRSMDSAAIPQESFREESKSMSSMRKKSDSETSGSRPVNPGVAIKAWKPDAEYTKKISEAKDMFAEYLRQKQEFGNAPSFYLDCSDLFINAQQKDVGIQVLSNLAELELENPALLRILAHRLSQHEELEASSIIFSEVLEMRKEEPQSYRDLALVLGRMGRFVKAIELLYEVVQKTWDSRFPEIEVIALEEMNNLIVKAKAAGQTSFGVDERLIEPIDVDLRIVMTWDADMTDMDLWVMEPTGEKAFYSNPRTAIGGLVSRDFTRGYGPEEYMIRKAKTGTYEIKTNFYGSTSQKIAGAVTLQVDIFTNYGRPEEKRRSVTLRLKDKKETFTVADVEF